MSIPASTRQYRFASNELANGIYIVEVSGSSESYAREKIAVVK